MDKSWIHSDRMSRDYADGVDQFIRVCSENFQIDPTLIPCPGKVPFSRSAQERKEHICERLRSAPCRESICLIPYNPGGHWVLTIINEAKDMVYLLDSLSNNSVTNKSNLKSWITIVVSAVREYHSLDGKVKTPGFKQLKGNLKQNPNSVECGFCVLRYMKEVVELSGARIEAKYAGIKTNQYYTQDEYDDMRSEWGEYIMYFAGMEDEMEDE